MDQKIITIGGSPDYNLVQVWDGSGLVENLPNLTQSRYGAACGYYLDDFDREVNLYKSCKTENGSLIPNQDFPL